MACDVSIVDSRQSPNNHLAYRRKRSIRHATVGEMADSKFGAARLVLANCMRLRHRFVSRGSHANTLALRMFSRPNGACRDDVYIRLAPFPARVFVPYALQH